MVTIKLPFRDSFVKTLVAKDVTLITKELNDTGLLFLVRVQESGRFFIFFLLIFKKIK